MGKRKVDVAEDDSWKKRPKQDVLDSFYGLADMNKNRRCAAAFKLISETGEKVDQF